MDFSASDFLPILSKSPKNTTEKFYFGIIPSLDLSSCIPADEILKTKQVFPYLDVASEKIPPLFFEEDYLDFLNNTLNEFFIDYEESLFYELGEISDRVLCEDCSFLERLGKMKPCGRSTAILHRYILAYIKINGCVNEDQSSSFFHDVSTILYANNYEDSSLSYYLMQAVSFNYDITFEIFLNIQPLGKLDYILEHLKVFCKEINCLEAYQLFKIKNSLLPCLSNGRKDLLELLLKYGIWRVFSCNDIYAWIFKCFGFGYRHGESDIFALLEEHQFNPRRYLLTLQMYYVLQVARKKYSYSGNHLSTLLLLWRDLVDPFLFWFEMYNILMITAPIESHPLVDSFCSEYKKVLCHGNLKPRSLKHYSRCLIRTMLDVKGCLPEGISCLNIPEDCKSYLRLEY